MKNILLVNLFADRISFLRNLVRVQVETGRVRKGAVEWNCCSQVDLLGVYCPELEETRRVRSAYDFLISSAPLPDSPQ